jgi:hypothetical protein
MLVENTIGNGHLFSLQGLNFLKKTVNCRLRFPSCKKVGSTRFHVLAYRHVLRYRSCHNGEAILP